MDIDLTKLKPDVRHLNEMRNVLYDQEWLKTADDVELYYMYRGVEEKNGIKHNITVILPKKLGREFSKTKGHYHIGKYQEIYTVLEGNAIYLMQKKKNVEGNEIEDVYVVKCDAGETIVIPSDYGHITINPFENKQLKMGDWTSSECKSDYSLFEKLKGACYYYTIDGWIKNEHYKSVPELRFEEPLKEIPQNLDFLKAV